MAEPEAEAEVACPGDLQFRLIRTLLGIEVAAAVWARVLLRFGDCNYVFLGECYECIWWWWPIMYSMAHTNASVAGARLNQDLHCRANSRRR